MRSRTVHLPGGACPQVVLIEASRDIGRPPDLALAFLPPEDCLRHTLAAMAAVWPDTLRVGCEAVTQFADSEATGRGSVQLFWFDDPRHRAAVEVIPGTHGEPPSARRVEAVARRIAGSDGALLLVDGLRFPAEPFLADLRRILVSVPPLVAGGLASRMTTVGARVFVGERVLPSACLAITLHGVSMRVEVMRGWSPASPVYTVTRAAGGVVHEIEGVPATDWYRRFFTVQGELAPMPDTANRFPLIVEGPRPERQGLYRAMSGFDDPPGSVTFLGDVETGDRVRLGMGNESSLVGTAAELAADPAPEAAILYSCTGRESLLGDRSSAEVSAIHRALRGVPLSGFFTCGEIAPTARGNLGFYNLTAILVLLRELGA
jgi:hypothetical protein